MTEANKTPDLDVVDAAEGALVRAISATPNWILAFCGGMVTLSVCVIAVLQLGGFSGPIGRIMNAQATKIERAAERIDASATNLDEVVQRLTVLQEDVSDVDSRVTRLEERVDGIDRYHGKLKDAE